MLTDFFLSLQIFYSQLYVPTGGEKFKIGSPIYLSTMFP